jgi:hypothetical protein
MTVALFEAFWLQLDDAWSAAVTVSILTRRLPFFGVIPVNERVVVDGAWVFAAGVTAGIDGCRASRAELRGDVVAWTTQLHMVYALEPPFNSGTPETAPAAILSEARRSCRRHHGTTRGDSETHWRSDRLHPKPGAFP